MSSAIMAAKLFAAAAAAAAPVCLGANKVTEGIIASKQNASASIRPMFLPTTMLNELRMTSIAASRHEVAGRTSQLPHVKAQIQDQKVT